MTTAANKKRLVYLAGPDVFLPNSPEMGEEKKKMCLEFGFEGHYPGDNDFHPKNYNSMFDMGVDISDVNEKIMQHVDFVIANLTPYRGVSADAGTAFEVGYVRALGKPCFAYSNTSAPNFKDRTERDFCGGPEGTRRRENGMLEDKDGNMLEDCGMADNLMLEGAVYVSTKKMTRIICVDEAPTSLKGFRLALEAAQKYYAEIDAAVAAAQK
eukprot:PhM_4_TR3090/c3_g2_i6/m.106864